MSGRSGFHTGSYKHASESSYHQAGMREEESWDDEPSSPVPRLTQVFHNQSLKNTGSNEWDAWDGNYPARTVNVSEGRGRARNFGSFDNQHNDTWQSRSSGQFADRFGQNNDSRHAGDDSAPFEIKISSRHIGLVIGKGGARIKELQASSGAKINVKKNDVDVHGMVLIVLEGDDASRSNAKRLIDDLIEKDSSVDRMDNRQNRQMPRHFSDGESFRDAPGVTVACSNEWDDADANYPTQTVNVSQDHGTARNFGGFDNQRNGMWGSGGSVSGQFSDKFGQHNDSRHTSDVAAPFEIRISSRHIGVVIGRGGANIKELQASSGARINVNKQDVDANGMVCVTIDGDDSSRSSAKKMIDDLIENESSVSRIDSEQNRQMPRHFGDGEGGFNDETVLTIASNMLGAVIGRGGQKIREIEAKTQTKISTGDNRRGATVEVTITGSANGKQQARELIEHVIQSESAMGYERPGFGGHPASNQQRLGSGFDSFDHNETAERADRSHFTSNSERSGFGGSQQRSGFGNFESSERSFGNSDRSSFGSSAARHGFDGKVIDWDEVKLLSQKHEAEKWMGYPPIKKNFYIEDANVANMEPEEVAAIREQNNKIMVSCDEDDEARIPNPVRTFDEGFLHYPEILSELKRAGFSTPSPIQMQGWPIALQGLDLIGIAQTGTGKTLAFLLPAFIHIEGQPVPRGKRGGPNVLVLSPTRELALQIEQEVKKYKYKDINCVCVYGGGNRREQINIVTKGVEIVVATPGRLNDLISSNIIDVKSVTYLVLDEADRMLDLGFEPEIRKILIDIRPDRQTIMTSATWPAGVRRLATAYMKNPIRVFVGSLDLTAVHSVWQRVEIIQEEDKRNRLAEFLTQEMEDDDKAIVFVGRKCTVDSISSDFALNDIRCQSIHGGREQFDREQALDDLKSGVVRILIATDVASRGLDIKDVTHIVNFDFPHNIEEYVHRIGRTGRAGRSGASLTFMTRSDWRHAADLIKIMEEANQEVPREVYEMSQRYSSMRERRQNERSEGFGGRGDRGDFDDFRGFGDGGGRRGGRRDRERSLRVAYM